ncbi:hypothetical protein P4O66_012201 [Electrophorus voltai]|uniref:Ig-like domain-containing protein n=1 Tax=Electrophorus voltai TaxID=2609070 RepID=A0AAD8Z4B9_9TELE|nr:hypothetical protein P4O66_012201 [Electrophorus voltai]
MFLLTSTLLLISTGVCESHYQQTLTCPYSSKDKSLYRVWCKRDPKDHDCCTGFAFTAKERNLEDGNIRVQDDGNAFSISVAKLSDGDGVYWCGLKNGTNIVKLAEGQLYSTPPAFAWYVLRWVIFFLLLAAVVGTSVYSNRKDRRGEIDKVYASVVMEG